MIDKKTNDKNKLLIDYFIEGLNKLDFYELLMRLGASQHYIISELEKIGGDRYFVAEERVSRSDIVFFEPFDLKPIIAMEYEQSGRYLETIQKMKRVINTKEGSNLKMMVFSFWFEDAEIRLNLLDKIRKDLVECSFDNNKIWILLGLSFPHSSTTYEKCGTIRKSFPIFLEKARMIHISNPKIPQYVYNGYILEAYVNGKEILSKKKLKHNSEVIR